MTIRAAAGADASAIADLVGQLGYPASVGEVVDRLERLRAFRDAVALVKEVDGRVVGVVTGHVFPSIHSTPPVAWLTTLVVDKRMHGRGVGRELVAAVEEWAKSQGAVRLSVTSGKQRGDAHAFYERLGYERTGVRLAKALT
jgi:GNAT superfamily N-acetyltransferase